MSKKINICSSRADRELSFDVNDFAVPTGREEDWRFSPIFALKPFFADTISGLAPQVTVTGEVRHELVDRSDQRLGKLSAPEDRVGALAWSAFTQAHIITLSADKKIEEEVNIDVLGNDASEVAPLQMLIKAEPFAEGTVILRHQGQAALASGLEVEVAEGAHLTLVSIQDWNETSKHTLSNRFRVGQNATLRHIVVTLGGDIVRITTSVDYAGMGGDVELLGVYYVDEKQYFEHRLFVDHNMPKCRSNAAYKGALQGEDAHSVWVGDVLIRPEAEGTDTYELNRNLVLTAGARADSVPNLEIETGDIEGAGHASATGRFDDEQLFYLKSRGIPEAEARKLVVRGFFAELIKKIGVESVEQQLLEAIEAELAMTTGE